jgi:hypothetical protein
MLMEKEIPVCDIGFQKNLFVYICLGTDRSNLVQIRDRDENYPYPFEQTTFWNNVIVRWSPMEKQNNQIRKDDLALYFASSGYYRFVIFSFFL